MRKSSVDNSQLIVQSRSNDNQDYQEEYKFLISSITVKQENFEDDDSYDTCSRYTQESLITDIQIEETQLVKHEYSDDNEFLTSDIEDVKSNFEKKTLNSSHSNSKSGSGKKRFTCQICSKGFSRNWNLNAHKRVHTGERPYKCENCTKSFGKADGLRRHVRIHTGEKPYICHICSKGFSRRGTLNDHMNNVKIHARQRQFICQICSKSFFHKNSLQRHVKEHVGAIQKKP